MSGIFGIFHRDALPADRNILQTMQAKMAHWGTDGSSILLKGCTGFGQCRLISTPEGQYERLPLWDDVHNLAFTASARLDNRDELLQQIRFDQPLSRVSDSEIIYQAYLKWGAECVRKIYGDWSFAIWDPHEHNFFLARDHYGNTSLFYSLTEKVFTFASDSASILALGLQPREMNELYLAQLLIAWPAYYGEQTIFKGLHRLPPAHTLTVSENWSVINNYWKMEDVSPIHLPKRADYIEPFLDLFEKSVDSCLRSPVVNGASLRVGAALSGGLDSSSISIIAANILKRSGGRLQAYTSIPVYSQSAGLYLKMFGDELPYAQSTARQAGNIDLCTIDAAHISPIQSIRHTLQVSNEPVHGAINLFWFQALQEKARQDSLRVLLTGQMGNYGLSWAGDKLSQPLLYQLQNMRFASWVKDQLKKHLPVNILEEVRRRRIPPDWYKSSSIHPDLAGRLNLMELRLHDPLENPRTALQQRFQMILPGRSFVGAFHAQFSAAFGLDVRDPSADVRLLEFTLSVPDQVFIDPETGLNRWLIRAAMKDRLPDDVRLNRKRGQQAADIIPRLRDCAAEVEEALSEIEQGPGRLYVDVTNMRQVWNTIKISETMEAAFKVQSVLTRGIMAGLWVNANFA